MNIIEYIIFIVAVIVSAVGIIVSVYGIKLFLRIASPETLPIQSQKVNYSNAGIINTVLERLHPKIPILRVFLLSSNIMCGYTFYLSNPFQSEIITIGDNKIDKTDSISIGFDS